MLVPCSIVGISTFSKSKGTCACASSTALLVCESSASADSEQRSGPQAQLPAAQSLLYAMPDASEDELLPYFAVHPRDAASVIKVSEVRRVAMAGETGTADESRRRRLPPAARQSRA